MSPSFPSCCSRSPKTVVYAGLLEGFVKSMCKFSNYPKESNHSVPGEGDLAGAQCLAQIKAQKPLLALLTTSSLIPDTSQTIQYGSFYVGLCPNRLCNSPHGVWQ